MQSTTKVTLISCRGVKECTVRLNDGAEVEAVLDVDALRERHGTVYDVRVGDTVEVVEDKPLRIVAVAKHNGGGLGRKP